MFRDLATASPGRYHPDLARSLGNLADCYSEMGRPEDAEAIRKEVATTREPGNPSGGAGHADGDSDHGEADPPARWPALKATRRCHTTQAIEMTPGSGWTSARMLDS